MNAITKLVADHFDAFVRRDRTAEERLLSEDFRFSSPYDDRIDRAKFFERCWPNGDKFSGFEINEIVVANDHAYVMYTATRKSDGVRFRNVEVHRVENDQVRDVDVYFGRDLSGPRKGEHDGIVALMDEWLRALHDKDAARAALLFTEDASSFGFAPPLAAGATGGERRAAFAEWFSSWEGPIDVELRDRHVEASGDVGFSTSLNRLRGTKKDARERVDFWLRATTGFRRIDGVWRIAHEHHSVPFDLKTLAASLELKP